MARTESAVKHRYDALSGEWTKERVQVQIAASPFSEGAMRTAHKMWEIGRDGRSRSMYVAKFYKSRVDRSSVFEDAKLNMIAQSYAEDFNRKSGVRRTVAFVPAYAMVLEDRGGMMCCAEPVLSGDYTKHNNNDGVVATSRLIPQAFSHFTYEASNRDLLVCDIQGVADYFTDPQILSRDGKGFGLGNTGIEGIRRFVDSHVCNEVCQKLKLPRISAASLRPQEGGGLMEMRSQNQGRQAPAGPRAGRAAPKSASTVLAERMAFADREEACRQDASLARALQEQEGRNRRR